jgi:hypothetical protein
MRRRSVTHDQRLLDGRHRNPRLAAGCPLVRRQRRAQRATRRSKAPRIGSARFRLDVRDIERLVDAGGVGS